MQHTSYEVTGLNSAGEGIIRIDGKVCFVAQTAPGDKIIPKGITDKKNFSTAASFELVEPSAVRTRPPCPYFGSCGGCSLQHLNYEAQLNVKRSRVVWALKKGAGVSNADSLTESTLPSPAQLHYRNRAQFHRHNNEIGFFRRGSRRICNIDRCLLLEENIANAPELIRQEEQLAAEKLISVAVNREGKTVCNPGRESAEGGFFSQVNSGMNRLLQQRLKELISEQERRESLLDLYCGDGNLSLPLSGLFARVTGVDFSKQNIDAAKEQSRLTGGDCRFTYQTEECRKFVQKLQPTGKSAASSDFDTLLIDPPRSGMKRLAQSVAGLKIAHVYYISCNPETQAADLRFFIEKGYKIQRIQPMDMFPQTSHVENLVHLKF